MENKIILIAGPTASGKSSLANILAKKIDGEIINADSIQIYKDLEILTARPKPKKNYPNHHLYGFVNGDESIKYPCIDPTFPIIHSINCPIVIRDGIA